MEKPTMLSKIKLRWVLELLAMLILAGAWLVFLMNPARISNTTITDEGWFSMYLCLGTFAVVHVFVNAIQNGIGMIPSWPTIHDEDPVVTNSELHFSMFSAFSLLVIPFLSIPVFMSLHVLLSTTASFSPLAMIH